MADGEGVEYDSAYAVFDCGDVVIGGQYAVADAEDVVSHPPGGNLFVPASARCERT
ncbi:hypothetical protein [Salinigranum salinum]|uniref:hypothetical protein n=1 Tax=Salinigranum salinum TaxID=1364937 RepID=UPI0018645811|nr:hypothetical protein [Salinigranum salinum]